MTTLTEENKTHVLSSLEQYNLSDAAAAAPEENLLADSVSLAAAVCRVPTAFIASIDSDGRWFIEAGANFESLKTSDSFNLCAQTILEPDKIFFVEDAAENSQFGGNKSTEKGESRVRFFVGAPLIATDGSILGALCAADGEPRVLSVEQLNALKILARQVVKQLESRRVETNNAETVENFESDESRKMLERRFQDYVNYSLALFCTHDFQGKLLSVNQAAADALGYAPEELVGRNLMEFLPSASQKPALEYFKQVVSKKESKGLMSVVTKRGEERVWAFNNVRRTNADDDGGEEYILGCAQDITELKRKEEELTKSRQLFQSFMDNNPAMIFLKDEERRYKFINEPFERFFQVRLEDVVGKTASEFISMDVAENLYKSDRAVLETEKPLRTIESIPTPSGEPRFWLSHKFLIEDEAGKKFVGGIMLDITERKQMEDKLKAAHDAALESARLKSAFLTNVSHEIRTPMNGVIGMTELLLDTPLDRVQRDYAENIRQSSDALLAVINDILDLAKIESGKLRFESVDFDIREVVESTVEMFAERAYRKNIEIASLVAPEIPQIVCSDPGRLRQVLTNLLGNAVKFTGRGEIGVWVNVEKETEKNLHLRFTVTDTGVGISPEDRKNLFQPFIQVDNSTTRQYGGTGLGLAISKQIVEMMNGEITVESQPQRGSQFSFTACFPKKLKLEKSKSAETEAAADVNLARLLKEKTILIADSSHIIRQTLKEYCKVWEMNVAEASSGEETLRLLDEAVESGNTYDIVMIDMNLPDWEGFSLARKIKLDKSLSDTNVILTTVYGQRGDGAMAQEIGVAAYLTKPVRGSQFFECLTTVLRENQKAAKTKKISETHLVTRHSLREAKSQAAAQHPASFSDNALNLLVVEDNDVNRLLITKQLGQIGVRPDVAVDGVDALEKIAAKNYQIVLMDCQMPRLDGYETTREIRRKEKEKIAAGEKIEPLAVIALTAHTLAGEREKCLAAGMNDYLSKPVKVKDLATIIEYWHKPVESSGEVFQASKAEEKNKNQFNHSASSNGNERQPLDFLLNEANDKDFAAEIYTLYLTETEERLKQLNSAIDENDEAKIARIAHAVRGNSLVVGATSIAEITAQIQESAKQNKIKEIQSLLARFSAEFSRLQDRFVEFSAKS